MGDIIEIRNRELIPADVVLIHTSDENGLAFVMTANLDGETNLKLRKVNTEMNQFGVKLYRQGAQCQCDLPNNRLSNFQGTYTVDGEQCALDNDNVLLRGTQLRNVAKVHGLVIYTGKQSKIQIQGLDPSRHHHCTPGFGVNHFSPRSVTHLKPGPTRPWLVEGSMWIWYPLPIVG